MTQSLEYNPLNNRTYKTRPMPTEMDFILAAFQSAVPLIFENKDLDDASVKVITKEVMTFSINYGRRVFMEAEDVLNGNDTL